MYKENEQRHTKWKALNDEEDDEAETDVMLLKEFMETVMGKIVGPFELKAQINIGDDDLQLDDQEHAC